MIAVWNLEKHYESVRALRGLTLNVGAGEILGLVGANGAGKTTALRCITGILPPSGGRIVVAGHDLERDPVAAKRELAFISDEPRFFEYLTAWDHLMVFARVYGVDGAKARAEELLAELGLTDKRDAFPAELSRGMKQKLAFACGLIHSPRALILDEPLTGLDPKAIREMKGRIRAVAARGVAVILSSHILQMLEEVCSRIMILDHGRAIAEGSLAEIRSRLPGITASADLEEIFMRATADRIADDSAAVGDAPAGQGSTDHSRASKDSAGNHALPAKGATPS